MRWRAFRGGDYSPGSIEHQHFLHILHMPILLARPRVRCFVPFSLRPLVLRLIWLMVMENFTRSTSGVSCHQRHELGHLDVVQELVATSLRVGTTMAWVGKGHLLGIMGGPRDTMSSVALNCLDYRRLHLFVLDQGI